MKGNGNGFLTLFEKLYFMCIPTSGGRTKYIRKHSSKFYSLGDNIFWQSRRFPTDPELISIGENVNLASGVDFVNHDIIHNMLNKLYKNECFCELQGCIEIGNNVMIGANTMILPNVRIGSNVVIGAASIVTKDIPSNTVAAGVPCKVIGQFQELVEKRKGVKNKTSEELWEDFCSKKGKMS